MPDDILDLLTDAVHYDTFRSPFSGDGAQFACLFAADMPIGIGPVHARASQQARLITRATLQLWLRHGDAWQAIPRAAMRSHPAVAEETARWRVDGAGITVQARTVYADERHAWHEQIITNTGDAPLVCDLAACGQIDSDRELNDRARHQLGADLRQRQPFVEADGTMLRCGYGGEPRLPCPALQIEGVDGIAAARRLPMPIWALDRPDPCADRGTLHFAFESGRLALAPGASHRLLFRLAYVPTWHAAPTHAWPAPAAGPVDLDALVERMATALRARFADAVDDSQLARARYALQRCSYRGIDGQFGPHRACLCTPGITSFSCVFFWDALFSAAAISGFDPAYARDALRTTLAKVNGRFAQRTWDHRHARGLNVPQPQAPVASWALAHHLALHDDRPFLQEMYPILAELHHFWETQDADGDGLPEWRHTGLNADNGPHYHAYLPPGTANLFIPPVASVSLASFLHLDALLLAEFATRLGRDDEVGPWRDRAAFLAERLHAVCWHADDQRFYDYDHHLQEHHRVKTHLLFWPLWAGVPVDDAWRRAMIDDVLLDPRQYDGPIPFPTCAYDDRCYNGEAYWSGRSWPHISYWLIETLVRNDRRDAAAAAADRWLAWQSAHTGHREAVTTDPHLAEHCDNSEFSWRTGRDFDYNWAAAAVALLRERRYDRFVPAGPSA